MTHARRLGRSTGLPFPRGGILVLLLVLLGSATAGAGLSHAQTVNPHDITYVLPYWFGFGGATDDQIAAEVADLRARLGPEGPYVKLGFTVYVFVYMDDWRVDTSNPAAVRAALSQTISQIDAAIARARTARVPISFSVLTAIRERYDPAQTASEAEDVRSMQWYATNDVARGWWTFSRYARKQQAVQEAYIRELGKVLANRMHVYPDVLVAASGDGEQEMPFGIGAHEDIYADYSPFTVAEFRDWLRHGGLYAPGQPFDGQGYSLGARYAGDLTPALDSNGDGHTLNGDFGTAFSTWDLLHFDWSLADPWQTADPNAIPADTYFTSGFQRLPGTIPGGFDSPRVSEFGTTSDWWALWVLFKQTLLQRHNTDFARWITTSPDPDTGATVPPERWYSYQIPADYLFNGTPSNPNERWYSSMSSWWTADIAPYGGMGFTAFNIDFGWWDAVTLPNVAARIAERDRRWGLIEWNPGVTYPTNGESTKAALFAAEMAVVERYRPTLLQPWWWGDADLWVPCCGLKDTAFESSLRDVIARIKDGLPPDPRVYIDLPVAGTAVTTPFVIAGWAADLGKIRGPGRGPGVDTVDVYAVPLGADDSGRIYLGGAMYGGRRPDVAAAFGSQFEKSGFSFTVSALPPGHYDIVVSARSTVTLTAREARIAGVSVGNQTVSPASLEFAATKAGAAGPLLATSSPQIVTASYTGPGVPVWTAVPGASWLQVASGPGAGQFTLSVANPGNVIGASTSLATTLVVSAANVGASLSVPVTLAVQFVPEVTVHPASQSVLVGTPVAFAAAATGSPTPTVRWQVSVNGGATWTDIPGATAPTYGFTPAEADNGARFRAVFTNAVGSVASNPAILTVITQVAPEVTAHPASQTVTAGDWVSFSAAATGTPTPTVRWQVSGDGGASWIDIFGAAASTYGFTAAEEDSGKRYRAVFSNTAGSIPTNPATLTVNPPPPVAPVVTTHPTGQTVTAGTAVSFAAAATGTPTPTVRWQLSVDGGASWTDIFGATASSYGFTAREADSGKQFRAVFTNVAGSVPTNPATLTVNPPPPVAPVVTSHPASQSVIAGTAVSFVAAATGTPAPTVQWQVSVDGGASWADILGATAPTYGFTAAAADSGKQFRAVFTNVAGSVASDAATLAVTVPPTQAPIVTAHPASVTVQAWSRVEFTAAASGTPAPGVRWETSVDGGATWTEDTRSTYPTLVITARIADHNTMFRAVFTNSEGSATTTPAVLRVYGALSVQPASLHFRLSRSAASGSLQISPAQSVVVTFTGAASAWTASADRSWISVAPESGPGAGSLTVRVTDPGTVSDAGGAVEGSVRVRAALSSNEVVTIPVMLTMDPSGDSRPPFGQVDTPAQSASGLVGAIGVTGWALDDVGVASVKIYRDCLSFDNPAACQVVAGENVVYLGDAAFLSGARPDVEASYPTYPQAHRAGWGYLLLTNMLPHVPRQEAFGGQGTLRLFAIATDTEGAVAVLGRTTTDATPTTIAMANDGIAKPFGAIDTPGQGATVSGLLANFGWALTPDTDTVAADGRAGGVLVGGVSAVGGRPVGARAGEALAGGGFPGGAFARGAPTPGVSTADATDILIPPNGSTMIVFVDGVATAAVSYNHCRGTVGTPPPAGVFCNDDIGMVFGYPTPQAPPPPFITRTSNPTRYRNLDAGRGAIGAYTIDTTQLANGLHTIAWSVTDSAGRTEGIGSRFFQVLNTGTRDRGPGTSWTTVGRVRRTRQASAGSASRPYRTAGRITAEMGARVFPGPGPRVPDPEAVVRARVGFDLNAPFVTLTPDAEGVYHVRLGDLDRLELDLGPGIETGHLQVNGYLENHSRSDFPVADGEITPGVILRRALPIGAHLDPETGLFTWAPPPGYVGTYRLVFGDFVIIDVTIRPATSP